MYNYILIGLLGSLVAAVSQIILKLGAKKKNYKVKLAFFINFYTITGYIFMLTVTLINLYIFKYIDLKYILIFMPTTFILVLLFSKLFLKEKIAKKNIIGYLILIVGIIIFNL